MDRDLIVKLAATCGRAATPTEKAALWGAIARGGAKALPWLGKQLPKLWSVAQKGPMLGRVPSLGRAATSAGVGLGATVLGGHAVGSARNDPETHWYNPASYLMDRPEATDVFSRANSQFNSQSAGMRQQMQAARGRGDMAGADAMSARMGHGDVTDSALTQIGRGLNPWGGETPGADVNPWYQQLWRAGGLNPFAEQSAGVQQRRALGAQDIMRQKYQTAQQANIPQPGDAEHLSALRSHLRDNWGSMLPAQAQDIQHQIQAITRRMTAAAGSESPEAKQLAQQMREAGMMAGAPAGLTPPTGPTGPPHPTAPPANYWDQYLRSVQQGMQQDQHQLRSLYGE